MNPFLKNFLQKNIYLILAAIVFFAGGAVINFFLDSKASTELLANSIQSFLQKREIDFNRISKDSVFLEKLATQQYSKTALTRLVDKEYGIFIYQVDAYGTKSLKFWNDQRSHPNDTLLKKPNGNYFVHLKNGQYEFIKRTFAAGAGFYIATALIPVHWQYYISPANLKPGFEGFPSADNRLAITDKPGNLVVKSYFGNTLFYLERVDGYDFARHNILSMILFLISISICLIIIHNIAHSICTRFGKLYGILFLIATVIIIRSVVYFFPDLLHLRQYELFDPSIYGSSFILSSLGDLIINALLLCWVILFIKQETGEYSLPPSKKFLVNWTWVILAIVAIIVATFVCAHIVQTLVADAKISFNVTNLSIFSKYSFIGFNVLAALAVSYFFFTQFLLRLIYKLVAGTGIFLYILIAFFGLLFLTFIRSTNVVELDIFVLIWLLIYLWLMLRKLFSGLHFHLTASEILFWLFVFSISIAAVIFFENGKLELDQRKRFANRLSEQSNPSSEKLISIGLAYFDNDFLYSNFHRFLDPVSNVYIKDSLVNKNFEPYLNKFETKIYAYNALEQPLYNDDPVSFDTLNTIFQMQGKPTGIEDLKYYEKSFDKFTYISKKTVLDTGRNKVGYLFILAEPKDYKSEGLVPELFQQNKEFVPEYSPVYYYAIYDDNNTLAYYYNNYPFPTRLTEEQIPVADWVQRKNDSYDEMWHPTSDGKVIVIAKKDNSLLEGITLFAYLFSAFLFLVALLWVASILIKTRLHWEQIRSYWQLNIRAQIHTTIIFVSLFSFLVIGVATIFFFITRYNRNDQERLSHSMQIMLNEIEARLPPVPDPDREVNLKYLVSKEDLAKLVNGVAGVHATDINLYDLDGQLMVSSNPFVYAKGILSDRMHPVAYYNMHQLNTVEYFNKEEIGSVHYLSIYCPVRIEGTGPACAYLNIPSFSTQDELNQEIANFLVTIVNLNVFIFLIAGSIALFLTNRITSSFILISEKMREINLGKANEEIEWKKDDEIGGLVKEYNKMVNKLGESASALAKSEREGAWREMARQVAHEIKNPLTPMKLSIQYLQKAIDNNSPNIKEMMANVAKTLVEQIDHLSKIASDFSQFANIGNTKNEIFDLHEMLYSLTSLYETTENLLFKWVPVHQRILVYADRTQLNRLFTNLLQNALEACPDESNRVISVSEEIHGEKIWVKVADNGEGIPEHMRGKIFIPNFTTKSSGTGLGLAMSKTIAEQARGRIWFETRVNEGTTFFVELPIVKPVEDEA